MSNCRGCSGGDWAVGCEICTLRELLKTYGDHRFGCAVRRQLRLDEVVVAACDCGWASENHCESVGLRRAVYWDPE